MRPLLFALIASATVITTALGQESTDSVEKIMLTPQQNNLHAFVGTWELTIDGVDKKGSAEIKPILGGRFITEDVKLPFGEFDMEWHGVIGYNDDKGQYTGVWFDNANNTTQSTSGEADASGRIITFRGEQAGIGKFLWRITNDGKKNMMIEMLQVSENATESLVMKVLGSKRE